MNRGDRGEEQDQDMEGSGISRGLEVKGGRQKRVEMATSDENQTNISFVCIFPILYVPIVLSPAYVTYRNFILHTLLVMIENTGNSKGTASA